MTGGEEGGERLPADNTIHRLRPQGVLRRHQRSQSSPASRRRSHHRCALRMRPLVALHAVLASCRPHKLDFDCASRPDSLETITLAHQRCAGVSLASRVLRLGALYRRVDTMIPSIWIPAAQIIPSPRSAPVRLCGQLRRTLRLPPTQEPPARTLRCPSRSLRIFTPI